MYKLNGRNALGVIIDQSGLLYIYIITVLPNIVNTGSKSCHWSYKQKMNVTECVCVCGLWGCFFFFFFFFF